MKPKPDFQESHMGVPFQVLETPRLTQLPADVPEKATNRLSTCSSAIHERDQDGAPDS